LLNLPLRRFEFDPTSAHVRLLLNSVTLRRVCLRKLGVSPVSIHSTNALNSLHLYISLIRRTNGRSLGTLEMLFHKSENIRQKNNFQALIESPVLHGGKRCRNKHSDLCLVNI
jgi:hypothetical protein